MALRECCFIISSLKDQMKACLDKKKKKYLPGSSKCTGLKYIFPITHAFSHQKLNQEGMLDV